MIRAVADKRAGSRTPMASKPIAPDPAKSDAASPNVMLPPIDATPEEITQALVRVPQPKRPEAEEAGDR